MTTRTFKQYGQAYGGTTGSIVVTLDGVEIYSGTVPTTAGPVPALPDPAVTIGSVLFSWTNPDVAFNGSQSLSIAVSGSPLLITDTYADYAMIPNPDYNPDWQPGDPLNTKDAFINGGTSAFGPVYYETISDVVYSDPFSNEAIDGVALSGPPDPSAAGQWWWVIPAGSTFTCTLNVLGVTLS